MNPTWWDIWMVRDPRTAARIETKSKKVCVTKYPTNKSSLPFRTRGSELDGMAMPLPQFHPRPRALNVRSNAFNKAPLSRVAKSFGASDGSQENHSRTNGFVAVAKSVARSIMKDKNHCRRQASGQSKSQLDQEIGLAHMV